MGNRLQRIARRRSGATGSLLTGNVPGDLPPDQYPQPGMGPQAQPMGPTAAPGLDTGADTTAGQGQDMAGGLSPGSQYLQGRRQDEAFYGRHRFLRMFSPKYWQGYQEQRAQEAALPETFLNAGLAMPEGGFAGRSLEDPQIYNRLASLARYRNTMEEMNDRVKIRTRFLKDMDVNLKWYDPENVTKFFQSPTFDASLLGKPLPRPNVDVSHTDYGDFYYDQKGNPHPIPRSAQPAGPMQIIRDDQGFPWVRVGNTIRPHPAALEEIRHQKMMEGAQRKHDVEMNRYGASVDDYIRQRKVAMGDATKAKANAQADVDRWEGVLKGMFTNSGTPAASPADIAKTQAELQKAYVALDSATNRISEINLGRYPARRPVRPLPMEDLYPEDYSAAAGESAYGDTPMYTDEGGDVESDPEAQSAWANRPATEPLPDNYEPNAPENSELDYVTIVTGLVAQSYDLPSIHDWLEARFRSKFGMGEAQAQDKADDIFVKAGLGDVGEQ